MIDRLAKEFIRNVKAELKSQKASILKKSRPCSKKDKSDLGKLLGKNMALARQIRGLSQGELGKILGVTFQQIQKYEKGTNRISAISLYRLSEDLELPLEFFFSKERVIETKFFTGEEIGTC